MNRKLLNREILLIAAVLLPGYVSAAGWQDAVNAAVANGKAAQTLNNAKQLLANKPELASSAQAALPSGSLTEVLMKRVGVNQAQAMGGAGALFQAAKSSMSADSFAQLGQAVPDMQGMLGAAPVLQQSSGLAGLAGQLGSVPGVSGGAMGNLLSVATAFQQQGMSPAMIQQFIPVVVDYVKTNAGTGLSSVLGTALMVR